MYGVVVTVSWIREANEASIGGLMVWWGWWLVEGHCEAPLHCGGRRREVRGPRSDEFADRLPPGPARGTEESR